VVSCGLSINQMLLSSIQWSKLQTTTVNVNDMGARDTTLTSEADPTTFTLYTEANIKFLQNMPTSS